MNYLNQIESLLFTERKENDIIEKLNSKIQELKDVISDVTKENSILKREKYNQKEDLVEKNKENYDDNLDTIDYDVESKLEEKIVIDIKKFKNILKRRFKNKNYDKILIKYGLNDNEKYNNKKDDNDKKSMNKNIINDIIKEIMLN